MHTLELAYILEMVDSSEYVSLARLFRRKFSHSLIYGYRGGPSLSTSRVLLVGSKRYFPPPLLYIYQVGKKFLAVFNC